MYKVKKKFKDKPKLAYFSEIKKQLNMNNFGMAQKQFSGFAQKIKFSLVGLFIFLQKPIKAIFAFLVILSLIVPDPRVFSVQASTVQTQNNYFKEEQIFTQDLNWGVLAMNLNKSSYKLGEKVKLSMAVLDDKGNMECSAKLELAITKEGTNEIAVLSTANQSIKVNPECQVKDYTEKPDFETEFGFSKAGRYSLTLTATTKNGMRSISSTVTAGDSAPFVIERDAPTRVFPSKDYPVTINVFSKKDFNGIIQEFVPDSFEIVGRPQNSSSYFKSLSNLVGTNEEAKYDQPYMSAVEGKKVINFPVSLKAGETAKLVYNFNAPDKSPEFYGLGKLKFLTKEAENVFTEPRIWQIANDAVNFKTGVFPKKTSTGTQSITGLGFEPKAIIFYWTAQTTDNAFLTSSSTLGFGFATETGSATSSRSIAYCSDSLNTGGNSDTWVRQSATSTIMIMQGGGNAANCSATLVGDARISTMDTDGFTLNWTVANNQAYLIRYTAYGGSDITNATTTSFTLTTGTGLQSVTDTGFAPDVVLYMTANTTTVASAFDSNTNQGRFSLGWTTAATSTDQGVIGFTGEHNGTTADTAMMQRTGTSSIMYLTTGNPPAPDGYFNTNSLDSGGFTVKKDDAVTSNTPVFYLAMKGGLWKGGSDTQKTSAGTQATTGVGFKPAGVNLMSWGLAAGTGNTNNNAISFGSAGWATTTTFSSPSSTGAIGFADIDGDTTPDPDVGTWSTSTATTIVGLTPVADASPTISSRAHLATFDNDGFTLNWTTADATARQFLYLAVGHNPTVSGNVYSDQGVTGLANSRTIKMVVTNPANTASTTYSTTTVASTGRYDFTANYVSGSVISVYLSGAVEDAVVVTKATTSTSSIVGLNLFQNYVIVRNENTGATATTSNSDLGVFDADNDQDVLFTANSNNFSASGTATNLYVWTGTIYKPGGTVTTLGSGNFVATTSATAYLDTSGNTIGGDIIIANSATTTISGTSTVSGGDITTTGSGILASTGSPTVTLTAGGTIGGGTATTSFFHLTLTGSGTTSINSKTAIAGDLVLGDNSNLTSTNNINVSGGDVTGNGIVYLTGGTFQLTGRGFLGGTSNWTFNNLRIGDESADDSATTTATSTGQITVSGRLSIIRSSLDAFSKTWNFTGSGIPIETKGNITFTASSSTFSFQGTSTTNILGLPYYNLEIAPASGNPSFILGPQQQVVSIASTTSSVTGELYAMITDEVSDKLYASDVGEIFFCSLSSGCDDNVDWTLATTSLAQSVTKFAIDRVNRVIYGVGSGGDLYKCVLSTGCGTSNWTKATTTSASTLQDLSIDTTNNVLYVGAWGAANAEIYRCVLSTGCDASTEWILATRTAEGIIYSVEVDNENQTIYAGSGNGGIIYKCLISTGCDGGVGEWQLVNDTTENQIYDFDIDYENGAIYAGTTNGRIYKCMLSTGCDTSGEWSIATTTFSAAVEVVYVDAVNGLIYAGGGNGNVNGEAYLCKLSSGCDDSSEWLTLIRIIGTSSSGINSFTVDRSRNDFYMGGGNIPIVYKSNLEKTVTNNFTINGSGNATVDANTYSTDLVVGGNFIVGSGDTFSAPTTTTVAGNFTNNGTFTHNSALVTLNGTAQNLSGTTTFYNLTINSSTTTLVNASTATLTVDSVLTINSGKVFNAGVGTLVLLATGTPFIVNGSFVASTSLVSFQATSSTTTVPLLNYYNLEFKAATGSPIFQMAAATPNVWNVATTTNGGVLSLTFDSTNGVMYAGDNFYKIYRCASSCTTESNWAVATTTSGYVRAMGFDSSNGVVYAGIDTGRLYRCASNCGTDTNWIKATTTNGDVLSIAFDSTNGIIYSGTSVGRIIRCTGSCDVSTNWTLATNTGSGVFALTFDSTNGVMYAGTANGRIHRCASSCDVSSNWTVATNTGGSIRSLAFDSTNGALYAGDAFYYNIFRCASSCDVSTNWTVATSTNNTVYALAFDSANGVMYAGNGLSKIYKCSTSCDTNTNWTLATTTNGYINALIFDFTNKLMFVGDNSSHISYLSVLATSASTTISNNLNIRGAGNGIFDAYTNNVELSVTGNTFINSGYSFLASATTTLSGNLANAGTFTHNNGTVVFAPTSTSTITSSSSMSFYNLTIASPGKELRFQAHSSNVPVFTIGGTFIASGSPNNLIILQSDSGSVQWLVHFNSAQNTVTYVYIKNSGCHSGSSSVSLGTGMTDGGGNGTCWFAAPFVASQGGGSGSTDGGSGGGTLVGGGGQGGGGGGQGGSGGGGGQSGGGGGGGGGGSP